MRGLLFPTVIDAVRRLTCVWRAPSCRDLSIASCIKELLWLVVVFVAGGVRPQEPPLPGAPGKQEFGRRESGVDTADESSDDDARSYELRRRLARSAAADAVAADAVRLRDERHTWHFDLGGRPLLSTLDGEVGSDS